MAHPKTQLFGFEIDAEIAEVATHACRGEIHSGNFLENNWKSNSLDFITFWEVLEHIDNPKEVVEEVKRLLKPGGYMIISVPNIECIYSKLFKQFW
jgi:2-polyprenyl-3-methyl-5-hydroxy-6-metoxy-1,4-benzoquinol methylase